jgi:hypothetical protein
MSEAEEGSGTPKGKLLFLVLSYSALIPGPPRSERLGLAA